MDKVNKKITIMKKKKINDWKKIHEYQQYERLHFISNQGRP